MIRVAHLLPNMVTGGRERIVADLCRQAAAHGIAPYVVAYDPDDVSGGQLSADPAPVVALDRRDPDFTARLRHWLASEHIDVLHAQGHVAAALARPALSNVPMVATLHIALGSGWRWALPVARGLYAAKAVTAVSRDLARRYRPLAGQPIRIIPTGVDLDRFAPRGAERGARPFTLGIAARLHPVKRHQDALAALRLLRQRGLLCRLSIAGDGPRAAELAALAAGLDVEFLGDVADMPAWLATLDALLLVSDHEGTPAALLEAMAAGLPCIATRVGGVPALTGDVAILVPRRSPPAIADAVERLMHAPDLAERLGSAARDRAMLFDAERQSEAYREVYHKVAGPIS